MATTGEDYNKAIKNIDELYKKQKAVNKSILDMQSAWNGISSAIFGISGADWFDKVPKTTEDLLNQSKQLTEMQSNLKAVGNTLNESVSGVISSMDGNLKGTLKDFSNSFESKTSIMKSMLSSVDGSFTMEQSLEAVTLYNKKMREGLDEQGNEQEKLDKLLLERGVSEKIITETLEKSNLESMVHYEKIAGIMTEINGIEDEHLRTEYLLALANDDISGFLDKNKEAGLLILATNENLLPTVKSIGAEYLATSGKVKSIKEELSKTEKISFKISKGFKAIGRNLASGIIPKLREFDDVIHSVQKDTGIMFTENAAAMTKLNMKTATFGMSIEDTAKFMGVMSDTLNTTNFGLLSQATEDLAEIQLATGMSAESLGTMAAEMMRMGSSSGQVKEAMIDANVSAKMFGVNSKKAMESISKNFVRFRTMGFTGGVESLAKMTTQALRLGQNIDEIFNVADKARSIEGAMEMAASLQLAGGSFANVNPMDLLSSARKGPAELNKILTQMGSDIGKFDKATGEMAFDAVDYDRLKIVADATGESVESIQNRITKMAQDNQKLKFMPDFKFDGIKDQNGKEIDPEGIKALLSDSVDMTGKVLEGSFLDKKGISDLSKLSQSDLQKIMKEKALEDANLEKQAKQNQSLTKSFEALKNAFLNAFTILQPGIEILTSAVQFIAKIIQESPIKSLIAALTLFSITAVPKLIAGLGGVAKHFDSIGGMFKQGGIKEMFNKGRGISESVGKGEVDGLSEKINKTDDLGSKAKAPKGKSGLETLAKGLRAMGDPKVLAGVGVTALAGPALLLLLPGIPSLFLLAGVGALDKLISSGFKAIVKGFKIMGKGIKEIALGSLAMILVAVSLGSFAIAVGLFSGIEWETLLMAGVALVGLVGTLALVGLIVGGPGGIALVLGAAALVLIAASLALTALSLIIFAKGMDALSTVDWNGLSVVGGALLGLIGPLANFALAGLMFVNPITLLGMALMIGTLLAISLVLIPLSLALEMGSKGLDGMASGVLKLSDSLMKLDFEKLDKLKEFSSDMADPASGSAIVEAMDKLATAMGAVGGKKREGGSSSGDGRPIVVQLVANGRVLQEVMVKDVQKYS